MKHVLSFIGFDIPGRERSSIYITTIFQHLATKLLSTLALVMILNTIQTNKVAAHSKGIYPTEAAAKERARQLKCEGTHENNGKWMPCKDEADLHRALRKQ